MADLDNLIGSRISLVTIQDIRYDGILFSINAAESSIVLRDVRTLGTEDRVADPAKKIAPTSSVLSFVSFPGLEIKDLFVHEAKNDEAPPPAPAAEQTEKSSPPRPPRAPQEGGRGAGNAWGGRGGDAQAPRPHSQAQGRGNNQDGGRGGRGRNSNRDDETFGAGSARGSGRGGRGPREPREYREPREPREPREAGPVTAVGTGAHLLKLRVKKGDGANAEEGGLVSGEFDFEAGLGNFNKDEVLAKVATEGTVKVVSAANYKKDDFFDCLSNDAAGGERTEARRTQQEERSLNQDTFGAIALQSNNYYRRGGYRGGGRGGRGDGRGGGGYRGRGRGRGRGRDSS